MHRKHGRPTITVQFAWINRNLELHELELLQVCIILYHTLQCDVPMQKQKETGRTSNHKRNLPKLNLQSCLGAKYTRRQEQTHEQWHVSHEMTQSIMHWYEPCLRIFGHWTVQVSQPLAVETSTSSFFFFFCTELKLQCYNCEHSNDASSKMPPI